MTKEQQTKFFTDFTTKMATIMLSKGDDYAGADRLSNFKQVGSICGLKTEQACLSLIATKVARLGQLLSGKTPKNESIEDSILDLCNYGVLLAMIVDDQKPSHAV
jgi:hypothetical protein